LTFSYKPSPLLGFYCKKHYIVNILAVKLATNFIDIMSITSRLFFQKRLFFIFSMFMCGGGAGRGMSGK